jgi:hypothetical protein
MRRRTPWASAMSHSQSTTWTPPSPLCEPAAVSSLARWNYEDIYRLCYVRGPEGIIIELAERIG